MYFIDHAYHEPRWAGYVRVGAAAVFTALVGATAVIDVCFMANNDQAITAAVMPVVPSCADDTSGRSCAIGTPASMLPRR